MPRLEGRPRGLVARLQVQRLSHLPAPPALVVRCVPQL